MCFLKYERHFHVYGKGRRSEHGRQVWTFGRLANRSILAELDKGVHLDQIMIETTGSDIKGPLRFAHEKTWLPSIWMLQYEHWFY